MPPFMTLQPAKLARAPATMRQRPRAAEPAMTVRMASCLRKSCRGGLVLREKRAKIIWRDELWQYQLPHPANCVCNFYANRSNYLVAGAGRSPREAIGLSWLLPFLDSGLICGCRA